MKKKVFKIDNIHFYKLIDILFLQIEDYLNLYDNEIDIDYEVQNYIFTIIFPNKNVILINKQESLQQIWMATKVHGYHFNYEKNEWICNRSNKNFWEIFHDGFSLQLNKKLIFDKKKFFKIEN